MSTVLAIATGIANLASVRAAFARLHTDVAIAADAEQVLAAPAVVLPGVGDFAAGRKALAARSIDEALAERLRRGRPTLAVCLGMQLCLHGSDEAPGCAGLAIVAGIARRFESRVRCPQMGWNAIAPATPGTMLRAGHAWFANSYRLAEPPPDWHAAMAGHGGPFVAALARDGQLLCQFHPELSGTFGAELLARWLAAANVRRRAC
jgi:imidazole glycerol-phosphate synthase subunit HisH